MATATTVEQAIVLTIPPSILGPESLYDKRRLALKSEYDAIILAAKKITVVESPEDAENANNLGRLLQNGTKECENFFKPIKVQIDSIKAPVLAAENAFKGELDAEKRRLGGLLTAYSQKIERERQEAERVAREAAEQAARDEALARAVELEAAGDTAGAEQILNEPIQAAPVVIQQEAPVKMAGQVGKTTYKCIVTDVKTLLKAVAAGTAPMQCFTLDQGWLDRKAALDKDGFDLPGCKLDKQVSTHFRN